MTRGSNRGTLEGLKSGLGGRGGGEWEDSESRVNSLRGRGGSGRRGDGGGLRVNTCTRRGGRKFYNEERPT